jgi:hypothetical protein
MFFKRGFGQDDAREGTVGGTRRISPDGQNVYHRVTVTFADGAVRDIPVRRALWKTMDLGDRLVKQAGQRARVRGG